MTSLRGPGERNFNEYPINQSWREQIELNWIGARVGLWDTALKFLSQTPAMTSQIPWKGAGRKILPFHYQKWPKSKIRFENLGKQIAPGESTVEKASFEWSRHRNLSADKTPSLIFGVKMLKEYDF